MGIIENIREIFTTANKDKDEYKFVCGLAYLIHNVEDLYRLQILGENPSQNVCLDVPTIPLIAMAIAKENFREVYDKLSEVKLTKEELREIVFVLWDTLPGDKPMTDALEMILKRRKQDGEIR